VAKDRERVTKALDALTVGLFPVVEREMKRVYSNRWHDVALSSFREERGMGRSTAGALHWDAQAVLTVLWDQWNRVFRDRLDQFERSLISELREFRNRWAHQVQFDFEDTYRILDDVERLLRAAGSPECETVARDRRDLLRSHFSQEARSAHRKAQMAKQKWRDVGVYGVCCASLIFVILEYFGIHYWMFAAVVFVGFAYLTFQRLAGPPIMYFGPHECATCGKIIYGDTCPYCDSASE
jgi:hypothetical protein